MKPPLRELARRAYSARVTPCDCDEMCGGIALELVGQGGAVVAELCFDCGQAETLIDDLARELRRGRLDIPSKSAH